jgi:class 3 adenylate cyclase/CheY-like chemotaxis protein
MPLRVLLVQPETPVAEWLIRYFTGRGDQAWRAASPGQAVAMLEKVQPELVVLDLHFPGSAWLELLRQLNCTYPLSRIIVTNKRPDFHRELQAREFGAHICVRQPLSPAWMDQALKHLADTPQPVQPMPASAMSAPAAKVRLPVRAKITIPYVLLALLFALAGAYLVSQIILQTGEDRFNSQLVKSGKQAADWMVSEENRLLETLRLAAGTRPISAAVQSGDSSGLRTMILPLAVNARQEAVEILDVHGASLLSLRHNPGGALDDYTSSQGETAFANWGFVKPVLQGVVEAGQDKYSGFIAAPWGDYFYVSGPLHAADGSLVGAVLVGEPLSALAERMSQEILAEVSFYDLNGQPLASTLFALPESAVPVSPPQAKLVLSGQNQSSLRRDLNVSNTSYSEITAPWEARNGQDIGLLGAALAQTFLGRASQITQVQIYLLVVSALLLAILIGLVIANQITRPLLRVVAASSQVASGNLDVKVEPHGNDEVAVLARSFNTMVAGLQEGSIYRDLLGRTVSPEVREQLRQTFNSGTLRLEGQEAVATVLITDIRGFTTLSEQTDPATVFRWLNEYFGALVPIITAKGGVVNKFDGDAMLAFFGILPRMLYPHESALGACTAAAEMLKVINELNARRQERGDPPLATGIGINTGVVTAGGLGSSDRLHYTIIGDTVNTAQRLEGLTRQLLDASGVLVGQVTYQALADQRSAFRFEPMGLHAVKGKEEQVEVYRLLEVESSGLPEEEA